MKISLVGLAVLGLSAPLWAAPPQRVTTAEAERLLGQKNALVLDVRTVQEYTEGHLPHARLLPIKEFKKRLNELPRDKTRPILVYCTVGVRSAKAAKIMAENGYQTIYDFTGGYLEWTKERKPIERTTASESGPPR